MYANGGTHRISNEDLGGPDLSAGPGGARGGRGGGRAAGPLEGATLARARVPRVKVEISARVRDAATTAERNRNRRRARCFLFSSTRGGRAGFLFERVPTLAWDARGILARCPSLSPRRTLRVPPRTVPARARAGGGREGRV